jgi:hypothetical protein
MTCIRRQPLQVRILRKVRGNDAIKRRQRAVVFCPAQDKLNILNSFLSNLSLRDRKVFIPELDPDHMAMRIPFRNCEGQDAGPTGEIQDAAGMGWNEINYSFLPPAIDAKRRVVDHPVIRRPRAGKEAMHSLESGISLKQTHQNHHGSRRLKALQSQPLRDGTQE